MEKDDLNKSIKDSYFCSCFVKSIGDARDIYTDLLINVLVPLVYEGFQTVYEKASEYEKRYEEEAKKHKDVTNPGIDALFQHFVMASKKWNSSMVNDETKRIRNGSQCAEFFDDLIRAVVKSHITILKCTTDKSDLIPDKFHETVDIDGFIHKCYIESAKFIYNNPKLFYGELDFQKNDIKNSSQIAYQMRNNRETVFCHIKTGIKNALREILPLKQILHEFLNNDLDKTNKEYIENVKNLVIEDLYEHKDKFVDNLFDAGKGHNNEYDLDLDVNELIYGRREQDTQFEQIPTKPPETITMAPPPQQIVGGELDQKKQQNDQAVIEMMRNVKKIDQLDFIPKNPPAVNQTGVNPSAVNQQNASQPNVISEKNVVAPNDKISSEKPKTLTPEKKAEPVNNGGGINIVRKLKDINANHFNDSPNSTY